MHIIGSQVKVFDSHFHIIDKRYPLEKNAGFLPDEFTCDDYLEHTATFNIVGGAIVSGSFQGYDQSYLVAALDRLGPRFLGVTQLPASVSDDEVLRLDAAGVKALRFNIKRGGSAGLEHLVRLATRVYEIAGWHSELYIDAAQLSDWYDVIVSLPSVSIDHLGLSNAGFDTLLKLAVQGVRVKATGFGRVDFDVAEAIKEINSVNPHALMFGTDLPSTRAPRPFCEKDLKLIGEALDEESAKRVLYDNAVSFYRLRRQD